MNEVRLRLSSKAAEQMKGTSKATKSTEKSPEQIEKDEKYPAVRP